MERYSSSFSCYDIQNTIYILSILYVKKKMNNSEDNPSYYLVVL